MENENCTEKDPVENMLTYLGLLCTLTSNGINVGSRLTKIMDKIEQALDEDMQEDTQEDKGEITEY